MKTLIGNQLIEIKDGKTRVQIIYREGIKHPKTGKPIKDSVHKFPFDITCPSKEDIQALDLASQLYVGRLIKAIRDQGSQLKLFS